MLNRFTKFSSCLGLTLLLGACSSVPLPFTDRNGGAEVVKPTPGVTDAKSEAQATADSEQRVEQLGESSDVGLPTYPTPEVKNGNDRLFARALEMLSSGKTDAAEVLLMEITQDQPEPAGPWVNLGLISVQGGDTEAAVAAMSRALKANPYNCDALNWLGIQARKTGQFDVAEAHYRRCLDSQPGYSAASLNLGILYELYMGRYSEALAAYQDYQIALTEPDPQVNGWMLDLERRAAALVQR